NPRPGRPRRKRRRRPGPSPPENSAPSGPDLRQDPERATFGIIEVRQPLLGAVGVAMDHVRRLSKLHAARAQRFVGGADVLDAQIEDRLGAWLVGGAQVQPRAAAVEEGERAERIQVPQPEGLAIPGLGFLEVAHRARDLRQPAQTQGGHGLLLARERAAARLANPAAQPLPVRDAELRHGVRHVILDGVEADTAARRDLAVAHPVLNGVHDAPLAGRENVIVTRPPSASSARHCPRILKARPPIYPPPPPPPGTGFLHCSIPRLPGGGRRIFYAAPARAPALTAARRPKEAA